MKLSIFTCLSESGNPYIAEAARSVARAAGRLMREVEWVVVLNHGGEWPADCEGAVASTLFKMGHALHVRVLAAPYGTEGIGALKRFACEQCTGDVLIELDHDDILAPTALREIAHAFEAGADFAYSDFAEFKADASLWDAYPYGAAYGWHTYPVEAEIDGKHRELIAMQAAPVTPQNLRLVDWAPNHVRAWRRSTYEAVGGHDVKLAVADDHDLVVRTYLSGARMVHIPKCLYYYRVHDRQTVCTRNGEIRAATEAVYDRHIDALMLRFCQDNDLRHAELCGGLTAGDHESWDIHFGVDLRERWPALDESCGLLRAVDALEHLPDKIHTLKEAYRVLAPGGMLRTLTPSTDGRGAFQDPTHVSYWNSNSFWYGTRAEQTKFVPALNGVRFAVARLKNVTLNDHARLHNIVHVQCDLIKLADGYTHMGEVLI